MAKSRKGRKKCSVEGCRKFRVEGSIFCGVHESENDASEVVEKVSELDAALFGKLDAEIRNHRLAISNIDYQLSDIQRDYQSKRRALEDRKRSLESDVQRAIPEYRSLVERIANDHGVDDPTKIVIDPDTRVIRVITEGE